MFKKDLSNIQKEETLGFLKELSRKSKENTKLAKDLLDFIDDQVNKSKLEKSQI